MVRRLLLTFLLAIFTAGAAAQSSSSLPSFDAVTVKPFMGTVTRGSLPQPDPGRRTIEHSTPEQMIAYAYGINLNQIAGLPDWARHDRFQVSGVTHAPATSDQLKLMLRRVLADRFQLAYTKTDAVQPVEALEVAPGGSNLKPWHAPTACGQGMTPKRRTRSANCPAPSWRSTPPAPWRNW